MPRGRPSRERIAERARLAALDTKGSQQKRALDTKGSQQKRAKYQENKPATFDFESAEASDGSAELF